MSINKYIELYVEHAYQSVLRTTCTAKSTTYFLRSTSYKIAASSTGTAVLLPRQVVDAALLHLSVSFPIQARFGNPNGGNNRTKHKLAEYSTRVLATFQVSFVPSCPEMAVWCVVCGMCVCSLRHVAEECLYGCCTAACARARGQKEPTFGACGLIGCGI